jgi:hypothetical protein
MEFGAMELILTLLQDTAHAANVVTELWLKHPNVLG